MATHGSTTLKELQSHRARNSEEKENSRIRMCRNADLAQVGPITNMNLNLHMVQSEQIQKSPGNRSQRIPAE